MNRLAGETSPYLLQHAHNPVDWYPWGPEALRKAVEEDKPILVSIGYSACHWCHVMEKESFENSETAERMNRLFMNIKIDREERPDLDHIYMDAVQAMTGSGGWPLNVFLTPGLKPFYGGTYFPPQPVMDRPSWAQVLDAVADAFRNKRSEIDAQAEELTRHIRQSNEFGVRQIGAVDLPREEKFTRKQVDTLFNNLMKAADRENGGFGRAPKFPQTFSIQYLLRYHHLTGNEEALRQALLSLDKMIQGGIYDQLGGGFARYSTDGEWLAPHFEKMLYDNALLVTTLCDAFQITGDPAYERVIRETLAFVEREMMNEDYGCYSALDADSEGVEGKFYVWDKTEVQQVLGEDAQWFCNYYDITDHGNWEHSNILRVRIVPAEFAKALGLLEEEFLLKLDEAKTKLMSAREKRIRPGLDDKILLGWNALMNTAFSRAAAVLDEDNYRRIAVNNMDFLLKRFRQEESELFLHTYKNGEARVPAFLDDYAYLIRALIDLQELTGDQAYLFRARELTESVLKEFSDDENMYFFYTATNQEDIIVRKKEIYDGATPSGNSFMASNLHYLSLVFNLPQWQERAVRITEGLMQVLVKYPTSFAVWAKQLLEFFQGTLEIAVVGEEYEELRREVLQRHIPNRILQTHPFDVDQMPLLNDRFVPGLTYIYLCRNYSCLRPVKTATELDKLMLERAAG